MPPKMAVFLCPHGEYTLCITNPTLALGPSVQLGKECREEKKLVAEWPLTEKNINSLVGDLSWAFREVTLEKRQNKNQ
jgi:hypothetical protein